MRAIRFKALFAQEKLKSMPQPYCGHRFDAITILERYSRKVKRLRMGFLNWTSDHLFGFYRNITIMVNFVLLAAILLHTNITKGKVIGFWAMLATINDLISHVSFLFAAISIMRFLSVFYFFSVITLMLRKMIGILAKFLLIFLMFWMIFAVCHISMAEEYVIRSNHSLAWLIFQNGAFEIFGEVDDEDKVGSVTGCADLSWQLIWTSDVSDMRCLFRSTLIPITVFSYMLIASIMLVNLLTALLSKEYDEVSGSGSAVYWKYENYSLLATYESKLWLPPPLSLLYYIFHVVLALMRMTAFFACIFCTCCTSSIIANNPFYLIPKWLDIIFKAIEGRPWGTLKQVRKHCYDRSDLELVRKLLLVSKNNKSTFHVRLRDLLDSNTFDDVASPEERIHHAQTLFQNIFTVMMDCISKETAEMKTRADTVMGNFETHLNECTSTSLPNLMNRHNQEISKPQVSRQYRLMNWDRDEYDSKIDYSKTFAQI
ncbi:unnamed protein product [Cylicocyclus nassatus]|uniref:Ion transport domain-containing protein n=1 Tax=Cylicocyclus nassatus TaxID=53992 RepID=A0AA36H4D9_CYLNA|nr:unnamed protein product [Cylicocyclus nassatus]